MHSNFVRSICLSRFHLLSRYALCGCHVSKVKRLSNIYASDCISISKSLQTLRKLPSQRSSSGEITLLTGIHFTRYDDWPVKAYNWVYLLRKIIRPRGTECWNMSSCRINSKDTIAKHLAAQQASHTTVSNSLLSDFQFPLVHYAWGRIGLICEISLFAYFCLKNSILVLFPRALISPRLLEGRPCSLFKVFFPRCSFAGLAPSILFGRLVSEDGKRGQGRDNCNHLAIIHGQYKSTTE